MPASGFADHFGGLIDLTPAERQSLSRLEERVRGQRRGSVLVRANDRTSELFLLRRGIVMSFVLLDDGSRQILRFHFPGDLMGMSALAYRSSPETLVALNDVEVSPIDRGLIGSLAAEHPRLSAAIMAVDQIERLALTDRLAALGRTSARGRVAALLVELRNRMRQVDGSITDRFTLGLTQEEIGDATGLTAVHVNRMLRQLEDDGLIARDVGRVTILDEDALAHAANYVDRYRGVDLSWLPPAR